MAEEIGDTHFVARIVIERVNNMIEPAKGYVQGDQPKPAGRKVTELATITLRNDEIEALKDKIGAHIALVDDIVAIDDLRKSGPIPKYRDDRGTVR